MKFCNNCGEELRDGAKFCPSCGAPVVEQARSSGQTERTTEYAGKVIKCPNCGEPLSSFQAYCPACGHEIRGYQVSSVVKEFTSKLEAIDAAPEPKSAWPFRKKQDSNGLTEKDKRKIELIRSFPIPNTREDLLEFLILASSNVNTEYIEGWDATLPPSEKALSDAWRSKFEQAYRKAELSFGDSPEFREIAGDFTQRAKTQERKKSLYSKGLIIGIVSFCLFVVLLWVFLIKDINSSKKAVNEENQRLNAIVTEIQECISEQDYAQARALTSTLIFSVSNNDDWNEKWDNARKELFETIERAESGAPVDSSAVDLPTEESEPPEEASSSEETPAPEEDDGNLLTDKITEGIDTFSTWLEGLGE